MTDGIPKIGPIEIKKGEGITYALKRIAQENKAIFSDGKITAKEWDKTLDALIEIQNDRKANNQKSIFGGGTDKTKAGWHNSFVVNPGDKIEFTEEELTKIFNSMGVSFSKTEKTEKPQPPAQDPQPVAPKPPVEEKNSTEGITQEERTDENGNTYTADIKDGQEVKRTYKRGDGTLSSVYEYQDGREVKYTSYAEDGKTVNRSRETEYDGSGSKTKETRKRGDGTISSVHDFKEGKEVKKIDYAADGRTAQRIIENEQVKMVRISSKTANDSTVSYEYNFDENGVCNQSGLADDLKKQISGPSLNSNTIALLKRITPENVVKVLTSYQATAGQSLQDAINEELGLGEEEIEEYINKALEKRKQDLGAPADISFEDLIKLDYKIHS